MGRGKKSPEKNRSESGVEDFACWERKTSTLQNWLQIKKENLLQFSVTTSPALYERNMKKPRKKRRVQPSLSEKKKSVYYRRRCVGKGAEHCPGSRSWQVPELSFEASNSDLSILCHWRKLFILKDTDDPDNCPNVPHPPSNVPKSF